jgi:hypothetical protein
MRDTCNITLRYTCLNVNSKVRKMTSDPLLRFCVYSVYKTTFSFKYVSLQHWTLDLLALSPPSTATSQLQGYRRQVQKLIRIEDKSQFLTDMKHVTFVTTRTPSVGKAV